MPFSPEWVLACLGIGAVILQAGAVIQRLKHVEKEIGFLHTKFDDYIERRRT
jgi:hypothetical protein